MEQSLEFASASPLATVSYDSIPARNYTTEDCPDCGAVIIRKGRCLTCVDCGYEACGI